MDVELLDAVRHVWNIDQWFPTLKVRCLITEVSCPACKSPNYGIRLWKYHRRPLSSHTPRCDVMFKCYRCSMTWCHGVPVPENWYPKAQLGTVHHSVVESMRDLLNRKQPQDA